MKERKKNKESKKVRKKQRKKEKERKKQRKKSKVKKQRLGINMRKRENQSTVSHFDISSPGIHLHEREKM